MLSLQKPSSPRLTIDTSYIWPVKKIGYATISPISAIDSTVALVLSLGTPETVFGFSKRRLQEYERLRKMPNTYNKEIVDGKNSCYDEIESNVRVRSLNVERWDEGIYYEVKFGNLVLQNASDQEKRESLDYLKVDCECPNASWQQICRAEAWKRRMFGDKRTVKDIPSPYVESPICKHAVVALNWLHLNYDTYDFDTFGLTNDFIKESSLLIPIVMKISRKKKRIPDYKLNLELWKEKVRHLGKLNDLVWRS